MERRTYMAHIIIIIYFSMSGLSSRIVRMIGELWLIAQSLLLNLARLRMAVHLTVTFHVILIFLWGIEHHSMKIGS